MALVTAGVTLDSGALIALERNDGRVRRWVERAVAADVEVTVPAVVIAEVWRGGHGRWLADLADAADVEDVDEDLARRAGELLARVGGDDTIDALVAASAARRGDTVVTSDPDDLQRLADDLRTIRVLAI